MARSIHNLSSHFKTFIERNITFKDVKGNFFCGQCHTKMKWTCFDFINHFEKSHGGNFGASIWTCHNCTATGRRASELYSHIVHCSGEERSGHFEVDGAFVRNNQLLVNGVVTLWSGTNHEGQAGKSMNLNANSDLLFSNGTCAANNGEFMLHHLPGEEEFPQKLRLLFDGQHNLHGSFHFDPTGVQEPGTFHFELPHISGKGQFHVQGASFWAEGSLERN